MSRIDVFDVPGLPEVRLGNDIGLLILQACRDAAIDLCHGDVVAVAQKIVSKAEGRIRVLQDVTPSREAAVLADTTRKDPRLVELMLRESKRVLRHRTGTVVLEHRLGFVCANAGIDRSNIAQDCPGRTLVALLPEDPDRSARAIRDRIEEHLGVEVAVLVLDSHGRAFREGAMGTAIGVAGMHAVTSMIGWSDRYGYELQSTVMATADEIAAAASLLMGQAAEGHPVVIVRGARYEPGEGSVQELLRQPEMDLFR
jgi:coenzyme F420-0:L-glutamate ligase / coenzyme F420-1:gamma-L-glutamate ligase